LARYSVRQKALDMKDEMIAWRRDFHMHPELGFKEMRTSKIIAQRMEDWGYKVQTGIAETGVVAHLGGTEPGPILLLRFDMDALPIQEQTKASYASIYPGLMHACGHDGHMAVGLAVARILSLDKDRLRGGVKFVFQPAEEILGGAQRMVKEGVLEDPKPDFSLAAHLWNEKPVGWMGISAGPILAGADTLEIMVKGKGGHGAIPNQTRDPILASAHLITALQSIIARNVDPRKSGVISVTQVLAGDTYNVIPEQVVLRGTIRTFESAVKELIHERIDTIATEITAAFECEAEVKVNLVAPPVVNDEGLSSTARNVAQELFPEATIVSDVMSMVSEDMAYMMDTIPGCYLLIGSNDPERGLDAPHHNPFFDFSEEVLPYCAAVLAALALEVMETR
jgi:amidohydrolase